MAHRDESASRYLLREEGAAPPPSERARPPCGKGALLLVAATLLLAATAVVRSYTDAAAGGTNQSDPIADETSGDPGYSVRLRVINGCSDPLWIANFAFQNPYFPQDMKLNPGAKHDFAIPDVGLAATRFWPKWGCNAAGSACAIGQSGGPGESCGADGCAPPIDSKFEATFGCLKGTKNCAVNPSDPSQPLGPADWWDVSQVDGWTLPYAVEVNGECPGAPRRIDCSQLALSACPASEDLGLPGGKESLRLHAPGGGGDAVGCYSPCAKLTNSQWGQGHAFAPDSKEAQDFCCPTPPISPAQCSSGPVVKSAYVAAVHKLCPSVYAYAYDDGVGLAQCPAGVRYDVTFYCPR